LASYFFNFRRTCNRKERKLEKLACDSTPVAGLKRAEQAASDAAGSNKCF